MKNNNPIDWCDITNGTENGTEATPICVRIETYTGYIHPVRVVDVMVLWLNLIFLLFLAAKFIPTIKKLLKAWPLFSILYFQILIIPILCCIHEAVSMVFDHHNTGSKVTHYMLRGAILTTEISVVVFGLTFKYYQGQRIKLVVTMIIIILLSVGYTVTEGVLDMIWKHRVVCDKKNLFTHGGMIFLFVTSTLLSVAYMITFFLYLCNIYKRWNLPSKKSFYRYALFLSLVNIAQAMGSMMWYNGYKYKILGNSGICITTVTTDIYLITFAPVVYWIFLSNYFRMNTATADSHVNTETSDNQRIRSPSKRWWKVSLTHIKRNSSNPMPIYRQILQDESTQLLTNDESVASSMNIGSYMSAELPITS